MDSPTVPTHYFNPRAPYGARLRRASIFSAFSHFNPRAPYGARPSALALLFIPTIFQSTRPIRGATLLLYGCSSGPPISIHAPHTGRDFMPYPIIVSAISISIHAPHTGRDIHAPIVIAVQRYFNPRAPYGARLVIYSPSISDQHFNPRAPYGARRFQALRFRGMQQFQSTRPIRGATQSFPHSFLLSRDFNPRAPYGARRKTVHHGRHCREISIHAPHTGRDSGPGGKRNPPQGISIHAPHTGRDGGTRTLPAWSRRFQSTRPIRGATSNFADAISYPMISIHAPHTGRDDCLA